VFESFFSSSKLGWKKRNGAECTVPHFPAPFYTRLKFLEKVTIKRTTILLGEKICCINYLIILSFMLRNKFSLHVSQKKSLSYVHCAYGFSMFIFGSGVPQGYKFSYYSAICTHTFSILQCGMHSRTNTICSERSRLTVLFFSSAMSSALTPPSLSLPQLLKFVEKK